MYPIIDQSLNVGFPWERRQNFGQDFGRERCRREYSSMRKSMREVLGAKESKLDTAVANCLRQLEQRVGVGEELGTDQEGPYFPS